MRAKPEMKPWVNTDKSELSSVGAALIDEYWDTCFGRLCRPLELSSSPYIYVVLRAKKEDLQLYKIVLSLSQEEITYKSMF